METLTSQISLSLKLLNGNTVDVDVETGKLVMEFIEALEDQDDVQTVTTNVNWPDELLS